MTTREQHDVPLDSLFPELCEDGSFGETITAYKEPAQNTPPRNPHYVLPEITSLEFLTCVLKPKRNNVYTYGPTGCGKTEFVREVAARLNVGLTELNGSPYHRRRHIVGGNEANEAGTWFREGPLIGAMRRGDWLLINEYDIYTSLMANTFKPVLEEYAHLPVEETGETIVAAPGFRVIVTCNTWGRGDDTGMYVNTAVQSVADLRRFNAFLEFDYLAEDREVRVLQRYAETEFNVLDENGQPKLLAEEDARKMVRIANGIRQQYKERSITQSFSTAELVNWAENYLLFSDVRRAAAVSFLNAYPPAMRQSVSEIIRAKWAEK